MASTEQSEANPSSPAASGNFGANEWLVEEMYERYRRDPASVDAAWHDFFVDYRPADAAQTHDGPPARPAPTGAQTDAVPEATGPATAPLTRAGQRPDGHVATVAAEPQPARAAPSPESRPGATPAAESRPSAAPAVMGDATASPLRGAAARVVANMDLVAAPCRPRPACAPCRPS